MPDLPDRELAAGVQPVPAHDEPKRGDLAPIDLDGIEMRWASQWNGSDDGEVRAWRDDVAALIDEVRRLRCVSNAYFEEMVSRTPGSAAGVQPVPSERNVTVTTCLNCGNPWSFHDPEGEECPGGTLWAAPVPTDTPGQPEAEA